MNQPHRITYLSIRRGFTLIELLVVITIIILALALAVPAFNVLNGSNTQNTAVNQITAMLGRARSEAIGFQEVRGVAFFPNASGQYTAMLVRAAADTAELWATGQTYVVGQYVQQGANYYVCYYPNPNPSAAADRPGTGGGNSYWSLTDAYAIDSILPDADSITLPPNVGLQVVCDGRHNTAGIRTSDGYLKCGAILFEPNGQLAANKRISIAGSGIVGQRMGMPLSSAATYNYPDVSSLCIIQPNAYPPFQASVGFVLFDRSALANQTFFTNPDNDYAVKDPRYAAAQKAAELPTSPTATTGSKEAWLDYNSSIFLVNRYNGTLIKGP